jgi:peptide/nickel transport system substrate-binding protein
MRRGLLAAPLAGFALLAAGCGGGSAESVSGSGQPRAGGTLTVAVPRAPGSLDPLFARGGIDLLLVSQIDEPLVERLSGPYGDVRRVPGLAIAADPLAHKQIWRLRLRQGVRFQDGARFNASAVLDNAQRWRTTAAGAALLPGLVAVDAPRPDLVRFFFSAPDPAFARQLAAPQLGVVSPRVLGSAAQSRRLERGLRTGTGAYELREQDSSHVLIARNTDWWGTKHGLGPALDEIDFRIVPGAVGRLVLLRNGQAQVAEQLSQAQAAAVRRDPLLTALPGPDGTSLGVERSVRGIDSAGEIPVLSRVWLTRIGSGTG